MEFSQYFLDKLLEGAVSFFRNSKDIHVNPIPEKFKTIDESIKFFKDALVKEAHLSMKNEIILNDSPILHAINLETENPGIVAAKSDGSKDESTYLVYKKEKPKKEKTPEQIEKEIKRAQEREQKKQEEKEIKQKEKDDLKKEKDEIKESKNQIKDMKRNVKDTMNVAKEYQKRAREINKKFESTPNPDKNLIDQHKIINENSDKYTKIYEHAMAEIMELEEKTKARDLKVKKDAFEKKKIRDEKKEQNIKKREEKLISQQKKREEKEKKIVEKKDENDMGNMDDLFDILTEAAASLENNSNQSENLGESLVNINNVKLYESPLPFQRHLDAIKDCEPNSLLSKTLLDGTKIKGDAYIKLIHGPPGTGKTYNLIKELKFMLESKNKNKHKKILICAPSNIATINLYDRAVSEGIDCSLIISSRGSKKQNIKNDNEEINSITKKVIFSTVSMSSSTRFKDVDFTSVMMDEASQCQEAWFWGLLRPMLKYIYMTGDPHQLPALVSKEGNKLNHERSFMDRMISLGYESTLLDTQRRMHPDIVEFPNYKYYGNKLKTEYSYEFDDILKSKNIKPFEICDLDSNEQRVGTSFQNIEEAHKVIELFNQFKEIFDDVIIISPYNAQCNLLKSLNSNLKNSIHSVDSYQGKEADVIILTTVRTENLGFWSDYRRLNVAMTRAKHILRIIGCVDSWEKGPLNDLKKYYDEKED